MNVIGIVGHFLHSQGYDGLYNTDGECACEIGDLCPCDEMFAACKPGYRGPDPTGDCNFMIYGRKEDAEAAKGKT